MAINKFVSTRNKNRNRLIPLMGGLDDGSTLSLDFTAMSNLDSRFTFTRTSTATFINSSGLVKYADHNLALNSTWTDSNTTPTSWNVFNSTTPNAVISIPQSGQRQIVVTSGVQSFLWQSQTISSGLAHTLSVVVHSVTGTGPTAANLLAMNGAVAPPGSASILFYKDGVLSTDTTAVTPGVWSMVFSGGNQIRLVQGSGNATSTYTIVISSPQLQVGAVPLPTYVSNSSTSAAYQAPRFDYDSTTLAPRGLLIEGSATNLLNWSESFATTGGTNNNWADTNITRNSTNNTDPANGTTALRITASAGNGTIISTSAMGTSAERTFSIWLRRVSGTGNIQYTLDNGSTYTTQAITSSWVRYTFAATTAAQRVGIRIVTSGDAIELWGAQLEAGSGASSYISTGSSTVQRAADSCSIALSLFGFNTTGGTFFADWYRKNNDAVLQGGGPWNTDYASSRWFGVQNTTGSNTVSLYSWSGQTNIANGATRNKAAATYGAWTGTVIPATFCVNNSAVSSVNRDFNPSLATYLTIGAASSSAGSSPAYGVATRDWLNNSIRSIKYWPTILPDATLQNLTQ